MDARLAKILPLLAVAASVMLAAPAPVRAQASRAQLQQQLLDHYKQKHADAIKDQAVTDVKAWLKRVHGVDLDGESVKIFNQLRAEVSAGKQAILGITKEFEKHRTHIRTAAKKPGQKKLWVTAIETAAEQSGKLGKVGKELERYIPALKAVEQYDPRKVVTYCRDLKNKVQKLTNNPNMTSETKRLVGGMTVILQLMIDFGGKIPLIGKFVAEIAKVGQAVLEKAVAQEAFLSNAKQGAVGIGEGRLDKLYRAAGGSVGFPTEIKGIYREYADLDQRLYALGPKAFVRLQTRSLDVVKKVRYYYRKAQKKEPDSKVYSSHARDSFLEAIKQAAAKWTELQQLNFYAVPLETLESWGYKTLFGGGRTTQAERHLLMARWLFGTPRSTSMAYKKALDAFIKKVREWREGKLLVEGAQVVPTKASFTAEELIKVRLIFKTSGAPIDEEGRQPVTVKFGLRDASGAVVWQPSAPENRRLSNSTHKWTRVIPAQAEGTYEVFLELSYGNTSAGASASVVVEGTAVDLTKLKVTGVQIVPARTEIEATDPIAFKCVFTTSGLPQGADPVVATLRYGLRDVATRKVLNQQSRELTPGDGTHTLARSFPALPAGSYDLFLTVEYGTSRGTSQARITVKKQIDLKVDVSGLKLINQGPLVSGGSFQTQFRYQVSGLPAGAAYSVRLTFVHTGGFSAAHTLPLTQDKDLTKTLPPPTGGVPQYFVVPDAPSLTLTYTAEVLDAEGKVVASDKATATYPIEQRTFAITDVYLTRNARRTHKVRPEEWIHVVVAYTVASPAKVPSVRINIIVRDSYGDVLVRKQDIRQVSAPGPSLSMVGFKVKKTSAHGFGSIAAVGIPDAPLDGSKAAPRDSRDGTFKIHNPVSVDRVYLSKVVKGPALTRVKAGDTVVANVSHFIGSQFIGEGKKICRHGLEGGERRMRTLFYATTTYPLAKGGWTYNGTRTIPGDALSSRYTLWGEVKVPDKPVTHQASARSYFQVLQPLTMQRIEARRLDRNGRWVRTNRFTAGEAYQFYVYYRIDDPTLDADRKSALFRLRHPGGKGVVRITGSDVCKNGNYWWRFTGTLPVTLGTGSYRAEAKVVLHRTEGRRAFREKQGRVWIQALPSVTVLGSATAKRSYKQGEVIQFWVKYQVKDMPGREQLSVRISTRFKYRNFQVVRRVSNGVYVERFSIKSNNKWARGTYPFVSTVEGQGRKMRQPSHSWRNSFVMQKLDDFYGIKPRSNAMVFILDVSGSMSGQKLQTAKQQMAQTVRKLYGTQRFNIIVYSGSARAWSQAMVSASMQNKRAALAFISQIKDGGGTNHHAALSLAFNMKNRFGRREIPREIFFMSDGQSGSQQQVLRDLPGWLRMGSVVINCVAVGANADPKFMQQVARIGRGRFVHVR